MFFLCSSCTFFAVDTSSKNRYGFAKNKGDLSLQDTSETMLADTYVWADAEDPNLYGEWDFEVRVFPSVFIPSTVAGAKDEGGGDGLATRRGRRAAATPKGGEERSQG